MRIIQVWCVLYSNFYGSVLEQYGAEPFEQQQFGTAGIKGVKLTCYNEQVLVDFKQFYNLILNKTAIDRRCCPVQGI